MSAITITVVIVYIVVTVLGSIQNVLLKALGRGELGLVEDPRSIYPHLSPAGPLPIVTSVDRGSGRKSPFLLQISLAQPS